MAGMDDSHQTITALDEVACRILATIPTGSCIVDRSGYVWEHHGSSLCRADGPTGQPVRIDSVAYGWGERVPKAYVVHFIGESR